MQSCIQSLPQDFKDIIRGDNNAKKEKEENRKEVKEKDDQEKEEEMIVMVKKKSKIDKFLEKEIFKTPRKRVLRGRAGVLRGIVQLQIKGKKWEEVSKVKHERMAKLIKAYWETVGFKTRIRRTRNIHKPFEVDIKNFVTAPRFPTVARLKRRPKEFIREKGKLKRLI